MAAAPEGTVGSRQSLSLLLRIAIPILNFFYRHLIFRTDGTVNRRVFSLIDPSTRPDPTPVRGVRSHDFTLDPSRNLWLRLFVPTETTTTTAPLPLVVQFHGGGFAVLSAASAAYDAISRNVARGVPAAVASVNYRLAPEHKCPCPYIDGLDALRFLEDERSIPEDVAAFDRSRCFLLGDSAGGNIAHHVARGWAKEEWGRPGRMEVRGMVSVQPFLGGEERTEAEREMGERTMVTAERTDWFWRAFLPEGADRDHEAANVFGPRDVGVKGEELEEGFPRAALVVVGGWDPLKDRQRRYAEELRRRGREVRVVEFEEAMHGYFNARDEALLFQEIKAFINAR